MSTKPLNLTVIKDVKRFVRLNILFLTLIVSILLFNLKNQGMLTTITLGGIIFAIGLPFYYYIRKFQLQLKNSYDNLQEFMAFDDLTEVYNRRTGMQRLHEEFARSRRSNEMLSLAMVDVDRFKKINDTYGHQAGDYVLKYTAGIINSWVRKHDIVFRYGGEEFIIILPNTDGEQAIFPLERLREKLSKDIINYDGFKIKISVSIGIASLLNDEEDEVSLIKRADSALYIAKGRGRNKVVYAEELPPLRSVVHGE